VLTFEFAFAPSTHSTGRVFCVPDGRAPDASYASINKDVYRRGNAAEMGRADGRLRLVNHFLRCKWQNLR
jgi:hypothetical protein